MRSDGAGRAVLFTLLVVLLTGFAPRLMAIAGLEGTFEFGLDAPWRIEPFRKADGAIGYGAIPIQITVQDARHATLDNALFNQAMLSVKMPDGILSVGKFHSLRIKELAPVETTPAIFALKSLNEIEVNADWPFPPRPGDPRVPPLAYGICRIWKGENPERFRDVSQTSEWHATLWYTPRNKTPGTTIALQIELILERDPWPPKESPIKPGASPLLTLRNFVFVHLASQPLPRFDNRWLYGDFHYHSQGTDNEGESGYNYRGVIRAMGAMGMDFVFATDHASSSEQIIDGDLDLDLLAEGLADKLGTDSGDTLEEDDAELTGKVMRDMDRLRFGHAHTLIYGADGVNREAAFRVSGLPHNYRSYGVVPQLFLGGEVDAIPEVPASTVAELPPDKPQSDGVFAFAEWLRQLGAWRPGFLRYGNQLKFELHLLKTPGARGSHLLFERAGDVYLLRDFQGLATYSKYGREHIIYFPQSSAHEVGSNDTTFIPSFTSEYGGATRRLSQPHQGREGLLPEIERKGVAFVAHHLNQCGSSCSNGPDGVPWTTDHLLLEAFRSPAILGLEFWNEDTRFRTKVCSHEFCRNKPGYGGQELGYERTENPSIFGVVPEEVRDRPLPLRQFRRGFIRPGGFRGGLFALVPFNVRTGAWQSRTDETEHLLHHGARDWDVLNLRGLDVARNAELRWLPPGSPRRMFMAGGSDAHGDLNFRRAGYFLGTDDMNDTAIGKPRNLVFAGAPEGPVLFHDGGVSDKKALTPGTTIVVTNPPIDTGAVITGRPIRAHTQEQIIRALRSGRYSVTDGPALRIAIDVNNNGTIDDADAQMGDDFSLDLLNQSLVVKRIRKATLLVEALSTPEFGPITTVEIYVGVHPGRVYAPVHHGVRGSNELSGGVSGHHQKLVDGYFADERLRFFPPAGSQHRFTTAFVLDLDSFEGDTGVPADRFFVRAFAATKSDRPHVRPDRYAFTNPIWLHRKPDIAVFEH